MGGVQGDQGRNATGRYMTLTNMYPQGVFRMIDATQANVSGAMAPGFAHHFYEIDLSRAMPIGPAFAPRRWGALACAYLGQPAS